MSEEESSFPSTPSFERKDRELLRCGPDQLKQHPEEKGKKDLASGLDSAKKCKKTEIKTGHKGLWKRGGGGLKD